MQPLPEQEDFNPDFVYGGIEAVGPRDKNFRGPVRVAMQHIIEAKGGQFSLEVFKMNKQVWFTFLYCSMQFSQVKYC